MKKNFSTAYLVKVALLSALAFGVMLFEFPIAALFPPYLKIDLSDIIALIGGITLGPLAVVFIQLIKNILNVLLHSTTFGIGEVANFLVGVALITPIVIIYNKFESKINTDKNGILAYIIGSILGIITMVVVACSANYFFLLPLYLGEGWTGLSFNNKLAAIVSVYVPFNAFKGVLVTIVGYFVHTGLKRIYPFLKLK